jgi:Leucine-rich repeat (LRR) protein
MIELLSQTETDGSKSSMLRVVSELSQALLTTSFIFFSVTCQILPQAVSGCAPSDRIALASFSNNLDTQIINRWPGAENYSDDCCRWTGVRCRRFGAYQQQLRVVGLDLAGLGLSGSVPSTLDRLDRLRVLNLSRNLFHGAVPPELLRMPRLRVLDLSQNNLSGVLSSGAGPSSCTSRIKHLDVSFNSLTSLRADMFQGLPLLRMFSAESNQLTGVLPGSLSSCSELEYLNMANNSFHGTLGFNFSRLARLRALHLGWNRFHGRLPASLSRCRELSVVNLRRNSLSGSVPSSFRRLRALSFFDVGDNSIAGVARALRALQECRRLAVLILTTNFRGEEMPGAAAADGIRGFPSLRLLGIANCALHGAVPPWLRASARLNVLDLSWNRLTGQIPPWLGGFEAVYRIDLSSNALTGEIPLSLTRLRSLADANASARAQLSMSDYGVRLYNWHVERGQLWYDSYIPPSLDLSRNRLTGAIPPELGDLVALNLLNLSWNALSGPIPATLASLSNLETLDLSYNELAGEIPASLTGLTFLSCFDVSHNRLRGFIPETGQFSTFPCSSFAVNPDLHGGYCGGTAAVDVGIVSGHDGPFLTAAVEIFGMPFVLGMIFGLFATVFVHVVVSKSTNPSIDGAYSLLFIR